MGDLTEKQRQDFRQALVALRHDLLNQLDISAEAGDTVVLDQTKVGRVSRMDAMQQQEMSNACRAGYRRQLRDIEHALMNLDQDEYGWCEYCGDGIDLRRLTVKPESRFCVRCQETMDT